MQTTARCCVLGAGSWGTALAVLLERSGSEVRLWMRSGQQRDLLAALRENRAYLPGVRLSESIALETDLAAALEAAELVLLAAPSHAMRRLAEAVVALLPADATLVSCAKGIETDTLALMSDVLIETLPGRRDKLTFLSGPSFAREVAEGQPTAVLIAGFEPSATALAQHILAGEDFRVYTSDDVVGVELAGALKNVMALAAGISDGLGFGLNTRAALITRGLAEMSRLAVKMGADPLTLAGLAGLGDLVLTCTGELSRNRTVGVRLGRGEPLAEILCDMRMVAEGVNTAWAAHRLSIRHGVEMPIAAEVYRVLYEGKPPRAAVADLMGRRLKAETA